MKIVVKLLAVALLLSGFATRASADITWTVDALFTNGDTASGTFMTDDGVTTIIPGSVDIVVSGPDAAGDFTATTMSSAYLPNEIGIFDSPGWQFVDLFPVSPLTSAGPPILLASGYDCPGSGSCATLAPEGSSLLLFGSGLVVLGWICRKRRFLGRVF